jgi:hypothetical protein
MALTFENFCQAGSDNRARRGMGARGTGESESRAGRQATSSPIRHASPAPALSGDSGRGGQHGAASLSLSAKGRRLSLSGADDFHFLFLQQHVAKHGWWCHLVSLYMCLNVLSIVSGL